MSRRKWRLGWLGALAALGLAELDSDSDSGDSLSDASSDSGDSGLDDSSDISGSDDLASMSYGSDSSYYSGTPSDDSSGSGDGEEHSQRKRKRVPGGPGVSAGMSDDDMSDIPGGEM